MIQDKQMFFEKLESAGEKDVRERLAQGVFSKDKQPLIQEWLRSKEELKESDNSRRRESREEEYNSLAREANEIARSALKRADAANCIAIIASAIAIISAISTVIIAVFSIK